jgi:hypothetical protein
MALPAVAGNTIYASDLYGLAQPSGGTEAGSVEIAGWASASGDILSVYLPSRSRGSVPMSISISTSYFDGPSSVNTPLSSAHLDANGVQIYTTATGSTNSAHVGTTITWQY